MLCHLWKPVLLNFNLKAMVFAYKEFVIWKYKTIYLVFMVSADSGLRHYTWTRVFTPMDYLVCLKLATKTAKILLFTNWK